MRLPSRVFLHPSVLWGVALLLALQSAEAGRVLSGHVPQAARELLPISDVSPTDRLQLAIGLPVRDPAALDAFVRDVSDPKSPNFRQYLTPEQFTERFGPTADEYQSVINFAQANGLSVTGTHLNRMVVDVSGSVAEVQRTFHIRMHNFRHPTEARTFFAPDTDPVLDAPVQILHISGLTNYWLPHPRLRTRPLDSYTADATPRTGSGPGGTFKSNDFRAAYLPGISLDGSGQAVGLLEFDGYNPNDIALYESNSGLGNVPLQNVLVDGFSGHAGTNNSEVCLDIEVAIAMAPGLSKVIVYEAPNSSPWEDILSQMANDNLAKQLSCSWGGGPPSSIAEQIFRQMAAQGQTFFNASGDDDAFTGSVPFPSDSPNVVQVGGTSLITIAPGGAWSGEVVWNWGSGSGSGGGISTFYAIPPWQQLVNMGANQGSTTFRNSPDVALNADNVYTIADNGRTENSGGTSCSAPLWAGFTALVNQQAANNGLPPVGFINPAIYTIATRNSYPIMFHDITSGNNITGQSGGRFTAVTGYDLCTGWGTPTGTLIPALVSPGTLFTVYAITTSVNPFGAGTVTGAATYLSGVNVTVTAMTNFGYLFDSWTENGNVVSTSASYTFTANADRNLVANFVRNANAFTISLSASPPDTGDVWGAGTFLSGNRQVVYAAPRRKYSFSTWTENGVVVSTSANYAFILDRDRNLVAQFVPRKARRRHR